MATESEQQQQQEQEWSSSLFSCLREPVHLLSVPSSAPACSNGLNMERLDGSSRLGHCCFYAFCLCICRPLHRAQRPPRSAAQSLRAEGQLAA